MPTLADVTEMIYGEPANKIMQQGGPLAEEFKQTKDTLYDMIGFQLSSSIGSDDPCTSPRMPIPPDAAELYGKLQDIASRALDADWVPHADERSPMEALIDEMEIITLQGFARQDKSLRSWQHAAVRLIQLAEGENLRRRTSEELVELISRSIQLLGAPQHWRNDLWWQLKDAWTRERGDEDFTNCAQEIVHMIR